MAVTCFNADQIDWVRIFGLDSCGKALVGSNRQIVLDGNQMRRLAIDEGIGEPTVTLRRGTGGGIARTQVGCPDPAVPTVTVEMASGFSLDMDTLVGLSVEVVPGTPPASTRFWVPADSCATHLGMEIQFKVPLDLVCAAGTPDQYALLFMNLVAARPSTGLEVTNDATPDLFQGWTFTALGELDLMGSATDPVFLTTRWSAAVAISRGKPYIKMTGPALGTRPTTGCTLQAVA